MPNSPSSSRIAPPGDQPRQESSDPMLVPCDYEPDDGPLTEDQLAAVQEYVARLYPGVDSIRWDRTLLDIALD